MRLKAKELNKHTELVAGVAWSRKNELYSYSLHLLLAQGMMPRSGNGTSMANLYFFLTLD